MATLQKFLSLIVVTVICWALCPNYNLLAQDTSLEKLDNLLLKNISTRTDSTIIMGIIGDINNILLSKFKRERVKDFYNSVSEPGDYFINMKKYLGWNFRTCAHQIQEYIINKGGNDAIDNSWSVYATSNFIIYYMPLTSETQTMQIVGEYLEEEFAEIKSLLSIDQDSNLRQLFIRSFYPDSSESYKIPGQIERTDGKIQIILFSNLSQFKRHFPYMGVDKETGGVSLFSLYQNPANSTRIYINARVAMVFGGYISLPFLTHELAHSLHFIYYSDLDSLDRDGAALNRIYQERGRAAYDSSFWPVFRDRIPGNNGIFEEAIANYAMLSTGALLKSGIVPPLRYLIDRKIKQNSKVISKGAQGGIDYSLLNFIGSKLKLSRSPEQKVVEEIFSWADFLKFLNASYSPQQMRRLYSIKERDLSGQFNTIFGKSIRNSEPEWCKRVSN